MTFTNMYYAEFDTTQANLLADLRTHILSSASWTRPNSGAEPDTYKCTTTRGAVMVFDLADAAISTFALTIGVWRDYDGTTFTDKTQRYLYWRASGGASTNPLHCVVSVSKEHVYFSVEGPRATETGAESASLGSAKQSLFMCDLVPYHAADVTPQVFVGGNPTASLTSAAQISPLGNTRRNIGGTLSWVPSRILTLAFPVAGDPGLVQGMNAQRLAAGDGKYYLWPYVVVDDGEGLRGRLMAFHYAGAISGTTLGSIDTPQPVIGSKITYDGQLYKLLSTTRAATSVDNWNQFGLVDNSSGLGNTVVVAVPTT